MAEATKPTAPKADAPAKQDEIVLSDRDAGQSHLTNNLVPQEGDYVTSVPGLVPPKQDADEVKVQDKTAPRDDRRSSITPDDRRIGVGVVTDDGSNEVHVS